MGVQGTSSSVGVEGDVMVTSNISLVGQLGSNNYDHQTQSGYVSGASGEILNQGQSTTGGLLGTDIVNLIDTSEVFCGVYGQEASGGNSNTYAVYGAGKIFSETDLASGGTKSFIIDHPLYPDKKILKHFCLESNEVLNVYRGTVKVDENGEATVILPEYFKEINTNFSYNLTPIGELVNVCVKEKVNGN
jgi:hypothetical protein